MTNFERMKKKRKLIWSRFLHEFCPSLSMKFGSFIYA